MKKNNLKLCGLVVALSLASCPATVFAQEAVPNDVELEECINADEIDLSEFTEIPFSEMEEETIEASTLMQIDNEKETLDVSERLNKREANLLPDNPRLNITGELSVDDAVDFQFFSVTSDKFMVARILSPNANYIAQLYIIDYETGEATPTNIGDLSGNLIALNGLPTGDYAFAIYSADDTVGDSYTLQLNATNPAANINKTLKITNDLKHFVLQYASGDVYGDGTFVYNVNNMKQSNTQLNWKQNEDVNWSGGYIHREHEIYNVRIKQVSGPASWSSRDAYSDNVMLIYCDVDTGFKFFQSYYQSGGPHEYSFIDTFGRKTPRPLDQEDFLEFSHILAFDLNTGKSIDFYSPLNIYYATGAASAPTVTFY